MNGAHRCAVARLVVVLTSVAVGLVVAAPPRASAAEAPTYRPPVHAPVADPFRPPPEPWLAGNRGIEYATAPGTVVGAIGPGVVSFAGPVAGALHVTVTHPDGLRSSYSYLAAVRVAIGDRVAGGHRVGVAAERLHLGVRRGRTYLDPASLWGRPVGGGRVVLVPLQPPPGAAAAAPDGGAGAPDTAPGGMPPGPARPATRLGDRAAGAAAAVAPRWVRSP